MFWVIVSLLSCFKLLLLPTYRSTDFEVHRNWLAITHSLPLRQWYLDNTSEWTLDYPPLFAWFEYLLSHIAFFFDSNMLDVNNTNYESTNTILFQRLSVIVTDLVLAYGIKKCSTYIEANKFRKCSKWRSKWRSPTTVLQLIVLGNSGLLILDHIHFQYNGILYGILLVSIANILQGHHLMGAFWFCILLNMKHIYVYMAPVYAVYLLRNYCYIPNAKHSTNTFSLVRIVNLGIVVLSVFTISFGPFILMGQLPQVLSRLFPFKRGLCHAYWAPNYWAVYAVADKASAMIVRKLGFNLEIPVGTMTCGLVQEYEFSVLPSVSPSSTFLFTLISMLPCLWKLWKSPGNPLHFVRCLIICSSCAFMFGWHVHEKAILMIIIPCSLTAVLWRKEAEIFVLLSTVGNYSLLPLLFTPAEIPIKTILFFIYTSYIFCSFSDLFGIRRCKYYFPLLSGIETAYIFGFLPLYLYENVIHNMSQFGIRYPFLSLLLTSLYCSLGIIYSVVKYYRLFLNMNLDQHKQKTF